MVGVDVFVRDYVNDALKAASPNPPDPNWHAFTDKEMLEVHRNLTSRKNSETKLFSFKT